MPITLGWCVTLKRSPLVERPAFFHRKSRRPIEKFLSRIRAFQSGKVFWFAKQKASFVKTS